MKIQINNTEIELRYSFKALMMYENIQKESFNPKTLSDIVVFMYSVVLASAPKNATILFDEFIEWLDANPNSITDFATWLADVITKQQTLAPEIKQEVKAEEPDPKN